MPSGKKFCPQCGNQLDATAQFCNKCGHRFAAVQPAPKTPAPVAFTASGASAGVSSGLFTPKRIAALACAILTCIFMLLSWISVPIMKNANSLLGSLTGLSLTSSNTNYDYSMFNLSDVSHTLDTLSSSTGFSTIATLFFIVWIVALAMIVIGLVMMFATKKHSRGLLLTGAIVAAIVAALWIIAIMYMDSSFQSQLAKLHVSTQCFSVPAGPYLTVLGGIATAITASMARTEK